MKWQSCLLSYHQLHSHNLNIKHSNGSTLQNSVLFQARAYCNTLRCRCFKSLEVVYRSTAKKSLINSSQLSLFPRLFAYITVHYILRYELAATSQWSFEDCTYVLPSVGSTKSFYSGIVGASEQRSSARLPGLLCSIRNFCSVYFVLVTFWRQSQHSWPSILRLPKTTMENAAKHLHEPKPLCVIPLHTAPFPRLPEYLAGSARQQMACTREQPATISNDASISTCCLPEQKELSGRLHASLHVAFRWQQTQSTHSNYTTEKQTPQSLLEASVDQYKLLPYSTLLSYGTFVKVLRLKMKNIIFSP